jgi:hypothetical protein
MNKHKLTLMGGAHDERRVPASVLRESIEALLEGARLATRFAVEGESVRKGPRPAWLDAACALDVTGLSFGSAVVSMEAPTLREADAEKFGDGQVEGQCRLFDAGDQDFGEQTAVDLFAQVLSALVEQGADDVVADRALLDTCVRFASVSGGGFEGVQLDGLRGRDAPLVITPADVPRIELLRDSTPRPQAVRVAGTLDTISVSTSDVVLKLDDGTKLPARMEDHDLDALRELFGKLVVVSGIAHYRPSGRILRLDLETIGGAGPGDRIFAVVPAAHRRPLVTTRVAQDGSSGVAAFFGTWPGEESEDDLLDALQAIG